LCKGGVLNTIMISIDIKALKKMAKAVPKMNERMLFIYRYINEMKFNINNKVFCVKGTFLDNFVLKEDDHVLYEGNLDSVMDHLVRYYDKDKTDMLRCALILNDKVSSLSHHFEDDDGDIG